MSLEIILDILLSAVFIAIYHADNQPQPAVAYACSTGAPLFGDHKEFYSRMVSPENYESADASHLITEDDVWVTDPMDVSLGDLEDMSLGELFKAADAIIPMDAEVAAELAAIDAEVASEWLQKMNRANAVLAAAQVDEIAAIDAEVEVAAVDKRINQRVHSSGDRVKLATVVQLRALLKGIGFETSGNKARLTDLAIKLFVNYGSVYCPALDMTFVLSDDRKSVLVLLK